MKKSLIVFAALAVIIAFAVPGVFAATTPQQQEIDAIQKQMIELRKQLVDQYVAAGQITKEQADLMKQRLDAAPQTSGELQRGFGRGMGRGGCGQAGPGVAGGCGGPGSCGVQTEVAPSNTNL
ncbi:hypothetical protein BHU72_08450 [Desulfuribacillus stibiiarsenatis]|uniref:DUF2680 domain-containing protein n=1 Tax=Desulfuribacillus stibiiarsenatis TaxID=1390249 RepID=A0A1E5L3M1_9FIRM|nr:DUF2680 domain-containing protein [Desulfuribacillus stibiiarsenatis]OEH84529.1 hypothetical protein BHU72_08450 [Desulfuribacillus stibiiarsenatis]